MKRKLLYIILLPMTILGENPAAPGENANALSCRKAVGAVKPARHMRGEIRAGFIDLDMHGDSADADSKAPALGGHLHFNTPSSV